MHFTRFHPDYQLLNLPPTPVSTLERAREIAMAKGLRYVYVGNVPGHPGNHTYCPGCRKVVIGRDNFFVTEMHVKHGACEYLQAAYRRGVDMKGLSAFGPSTGSGSPRATSRGGLRLPAVSGLRPWTALACLALLLGCRRRCRGARAGPPACVNRRWQASSTPAMPVRSARRSTR